jgi:hypothetical protein
MIEPGFIQEKVKMSLTSLPWIKYWFVIIILQLFTPLVSSASDYIGIDTSHFVFYFHSQDKRLMKSLIDDAEALRKL